ncbi:MAG TPA: PilZ domain-containing protein [Terracidiphilus sp.]|nr:PilZ domain-containing protein [Terracidiphilus sp.]
MTLASSSVQKHLPPDRRRSERRASPDLAAYHWVGALAKQAPVRDISSTGVYLLTQERWAPGDTVSLTLQRKGPPEGNFDRRVVVQAKAVRTGEDGIAMSFVLPAGMDLRLWESPLKSAAEQTAPEDILREFRMAGALAFLRSISPTAIDDVERLLREGLSNFRVASAMEIALTAERILSFGPVPERMRAPASIVLRILEEGSWADAEATQHLWAGLLATSCSLSGTDESNLIFVNLLCQLTSTHVRLLTAACAKATKFVAGVERISSRPITLTARDMLHITGSRDLIRIHRDLEYLSDVGLLTAVVKTQSFSPIEGTQIAPTSLGMQLFARCNGYRGATQEPLDVPSSPLSNGTPKQEVFVPDGAPRH